MKTLFLNPPFTGRFDNVGSRFQATRRTKSLWYPAWLCYAAGLLKDSKVIDCPAEGVTPEGLMRMIDGYEVVVIHTSGPSVKNDVFFAERIKDKLDCRVVFVGPYASVLPEEVLNMSRSIDAVARGEYEYTVSEISGNRDWKKIKGLSWRQRDKIIHNPDRPLEKNLDKIPFVSRIYKRDLNVSKYYLSFALYPYVSVFSSRGCPNRCTYCAWSQTFTGRGYRFRTVKDLVNETLFIEEKLPAVKEIFFDDDNFTGNINRVKEFCDSVKSLDLTWSCNSRADVESDVLRKMKDAGCRLLVVGYESFNQKILNNVRKGISIKRMQDFTRDCKRAGLMIHGTFMVGLPGETKETVNKTIDFVCGLDLDTIQVSVAMPFQGTEFHEYCESNGFLRDMNYVDNNGHVMPVMEYPDFSRKEILNAVEQFNVMYYYRPRYLFRIFKKMFLHPRESKRVLLSSLPFHYYMLGWLMRKHR